MEIILALAGVLAVLVISEVGWRRHIFRGESARKFVHITVGSFVAFWPYFMSWRQIQLMSLAFMVVILLSMQKHVFHAIHEVNRRTWGELFFPVGIGLSALIMPPPIIFTAAILHLSLADGLAAVVGKKFGLLHQYRIHRYSKTLAGTLMFFLTSLLIISSTVVLSGNTISWPLLPLLIWLPVAATIVENISPAGTDNVFVPLLVIVVLQAAGV